MVGYGGEELILREHPTNVLSLLIPVLVLKSGLRSVSGLTRVVRSVYGELRDIPEEPDTEFQLCMDIGGPLVSRFCRDQTVGIVSYGSRPSLFMSGYGIYWKSSF